MCRPLHHATRGRGLLRGILKLSKGCPGARAPHHYWTRPAFEFPRRAHTERARWSTKNPRPHQGGAAVGRRERREQYFRRREAKIPI